MVPSFAPLHVMLVDVTVAFKAFGSVIFSLPNDTEQEIFAAS